MTDQFAEGFEGFYDEWFARVYNYARHRTGSPTRADEIVSDTFSRVLKSWSSFDSARGDRRTWLFSIAFRAIADHYRAESRRRWFSLDGIKEPGEPGPEGGAEANEEQERLVAALQELPEQSREIVALKFFSGMTNRSISQLLGLSESNVAVILFRSIRRMRRDFAGVEGSHE